MEKGVHLRGKTWCAAHALRSSQVRMESKIIKKKVSRLSVIHVYVNNYVHFS